MINPQKNLNNINPLIDTDRVEIVFYTDPLCCWSWALFPELLRLRADFEDLVTISYCIGGLIKDWNNFADPLNNVSQPSQMGPIWMEAAQKTGINFSHYLWVDDPPTSSYPACIAVKTAGLQSLLAEELYFKNIAEAAMLNGMNISKPEVLVQIAQQLSEEFPDIFDPSHFLQNYNNEESRNAFRQDLQKIKSNGIGRFPTVTMAYRQKKIMFTGYRSYDVLLDAFSKIRDKSI